ncbi:MAG: TetR family transcriptional regulator C-terminal domain-containing protein [Alphaproteobacteria bacterium]|jgi:TetR/AcrR family transcriptional repressor of bet genes
MPLKVDHIARRAEIAGAAIEAIATRGLDAVRLVDVARATDATTGQIVHYYPDKDAVLLAALDAIIARLVERLLQPSSTGDIMAEIAEALPLDPQRLREWNIWLQFAGRSSHTEAFRSRNADYYRQISAALADRLAAHAGTAGGKALADAIIAMVDGIGMRAALEPEDWPASRQKRILRLMIAALLETHAGSRKRRDKRRKR